MEKKIRMLLTRHPYDGHERGYNVVATGLRERGIEVILGGAQLAGEIVETAIQEDVDFIGYRITSGEPTILVEILFQKLKEKGADIPVIVGGIVPTKDIPRLKGMGVTEIFRPGNSMDSIADFVKNYHSGNQGGKEKS
jgi:methylmalonyl-CoA mutase C-terminal domain/subunit